ncbi:MAG TPA: ABC transporter ATP-binding protein [Bacteroidales bacterium]|nr:ABC transporter ATP-binding protein [Bacteroidales bacterium]HOK98939.1 ABC transporter ATP-binding protein [Bacteroidales bacterium]HPO65118.1 ABC transporter ATP-binding protein [Bacteroidales bacterium]
MFRLNQVSKSYHEVLAIEDLTFEVKPNELLGFIGPDGSGKTTLFRILATLLLPDQGKITYGQYDLVKDYQQIRPRLGYMPGRFSLYPDLTVEENLNFFATLYGTSIAQNYDLIDDIYVQLEPFANRPAGKLSGGMKQKLALCCALVHRPEVLILDEPTTGVDAVSRKEFWMLLKKLQHQGVTILVSTPYMDEASLCDRVILMQKGKILSTDTPTGLIAKYPENLYAALGENIYSLKKALASMPECKTAYLSGRKVHFTIANGYGVSDITRGLNQRGISQITIERMEPTVEDCFIYYMQHE